MFAKVFRQIFESSIAEDPELRFTFTDLLVLADSDGCVDITHEALARITNRPLDVIRRTIGSLESPDLKSRTPELDGRRIERLDEHRDWGWRIVNYLKFRNTANEEQRKQGQRDRFNRWKGKQLQSSNGSLTPANGSNAMQRQRQRQRQIPPIVPQGGQGELLNSIKGIPLPTELSTPKTEAAWSEWQTHRAEKKKKLTPLTMKHQLDLLMKWGPDRWVAAINHSIEKGWQGLFEPRQERNGSNGGAPPGIQLRIIEEELLKHPGNPDSVYSDRSNITPELHKQFRAMVAKASDLRRQIAISGGRP